MKKISLKKPTPLKARLLTLPDDQREKLIEWMTSGMLYSDIRDRVAKEFGIVLKSNTPFEKFWKIVCHPIVKQRKLGIEPPPTSSTVNRGIEKMLQDSATTVEDLKQVLTLAVKAGQIELDLEKLNYKAVNKDSAKKSPIEEQNPLDDQEKLDEVRRQVFGSAPNAEKPGSPTQ
jgi:hypothetical protein